MFSWGSQRTRQQAPEAAGRKPAAWGLHVSLCSKTFQGASLALFFAVFCLGLAQREAWASPAETFGLDADSLGRAMMGQAASSALSASATNPARLLKAEGVELAFNVLLAEDFLKVNHRDVALEPYVAYGLALAARLPLGPFKDRLFLGANVHLPHKELYALNHTDAKAPRILFEGGHGRRLTVDVALALRLWERLSLGLALSASPSVGGNVHIDFAQKQQQAHQTQLWVRSKILPSFGLYIELFDSLSLGLSYRMAQRSYFEVPVSVLVNSSMSAIRAAVSGVAYGEPHRLAAGLSYDFSALSPRQLWHFKWHVEAHYQLYHNDIASKAEIRLLNEQGEEVERIAMPSFEFRNSWRLALALDWLPLEDFCLSLGYAFRQSPVPAQRGQANLLDAPRHQFSLGLQYRLPERWLALPRLSFAFSLRYEHLLTRHMEKSKQLIDNPGYPYLRYEGSLIQSHFNIALAFDGY